MKQIKAISMVTTIIYLVDLILCMLSILVLVFLSIILGGTADSVINHPGANLVGVLFWLLAGGAAIAATPYEQGSIGDPGAPTLKPTIY